MKELELNLQHTKKLYEMCEVFFPNLSHITEENLLFFKWSEDEEMTSMHWFEFCLTHLADAVFMASEEYSMPQPAFYNQRNKFLMCCLFVRDEGENYLEHPINYLYQEFKKLK